MKTIDHDRNETGRKGLPDYDRAWVHKKYGPNVNWTAMLPLVVIAAGLYFARVGWPF